MGARVVSSFEIWGWGLGVGLSLLPLAVAHRRFAGLVCEVAFLGRARPGLRLASDGL